MKRVLSFSLFAIACIIICSCKDKNGQIPPTSTAETPTGTAATVLEFYKVFCTDWDGQSKTDSILLKYCTKELRDVVMDALTTDAYDFVTNGVPGIDTKSLSVVKRNEKYVVSFEYAKWPVSDEPGKDSIYVMVNKENKISYLIRPSDNYRIPGVYSSKSPLLYYYEHQYVDLGLSVNWATSNIGSRSVDPQWPGDLFAWGETVTRDHFDKNYYLAPIQDHYYEGKLSLLEQDDDAAAALWGKDWRLPTKEEFQEMIDKCKWEWTRENYSYWGYKVTGPNGNSIFLPAGGMKRRNESINREHGLYYWTASCKFDDPEREPKAWQFLSTSDEPDKSKNRNLIMTLVPLSIQSGRSIRPVTDKPYIPISDIGLNKKELKLEIGEDFVLTASFFPKGATPRNLYWHSGNSAVAHIDTNGKVTAVSAGTCTITAVCVELKKECQVTVVMPKDFVPVEPKVTTVFEFGKEVNKAYIDDLQEFDDSLELKEVFRTHIGNKSKGFDITFSDFTDEAWSDDPGEFCMITIETAGKQYRFKNSDWVTDYRFDDKYYLCYPMGKSRYLLFLKGFDYGCCPGVLTVLAIDETGARVVYNKESNLNEINIEPFSMTFEEWYAESVSRYKTYYSNAYNLFVEDDALKMKKVELLRE